MENMDIRRQPDGCYLVVEEVPDFDTQEEFSFRMLTENRIEGLLEPKLQIFNGERSLYYEITGMQSLENYASVHSLSAEDLRSLFGRLLWLTRQLPDYFLDVMNLVLSPKHIYLSEEGFFFCYGLGERKEERRREAFAGELIGLIDHEDEMAVVYAYQFYQLMQSGGELSDVLQKVVGSRDQAPEEETDRQRSEPGQEVCMETGEEKTGEKKQQRQKKRDLPGTLLFFLVFLVGVALLAVREEIPGLVFTFSGAGGIFFTFFAGKG
ncbi:MAG: DUF6382 domain-containing protein [Lachnospiraceae bacterium]|nr:DUF6382 domain-containing protein [Lachnospiraceae bacterium]